MHPRRHRKLSTTGATDKVILVVTIGSVKATILSHVCAVQYAICLFKNFFFYFGLVMDIPENYQANYRYARKKINKNACIKISAFNQHFVLPFKIEDNCRSRVACRMLHASVCSWMRLPLKLCRHTVFGNALVNALHIRKHTRSQCTYAPLAIGAGSVGGQRSNARSCDISQQLYTEHFLYI